MKKEKMIAFYRAEIRNYKKLCFEANLITFCFISRSNLSSCQVGSDN